MRVIASHLLSVSRRAVVPQARLYATGATGRSIVTLKDTKVTVCGSPVGTTQSDQCTVHRDRTRRRPGTQRKSPLRRRGTLDAAPRRTQSPGWAWRWNEPRAALCDGLRMYVERRRMLTPS